MANRVNHIFPECFVDTNIMKTLLHLDGVNHQHGCSKVMSGMASGRFADGFAIGIADDDKKKTYDCGEFLELCRSSHLILMKHKVKHHYLIFVHEAAEDLLLSSALELNINMSDFNLPDSLEELKEITKNNESDKEPRIRKLINYIRGASEMARLERILTYLQSNQYNVNSDELIHEFWGDEIDYGTKNRR